MVSGRCPACGRVLGVIQVLLKFEAKLPLILEQGKPMFLLCVFSVCTVTAGALNLDFLDGKQYVTVNVTFSSTLCVCLKR